MKINLPKIREKLQSFWGFLTLAFLFLGLAASVILVTERQEIRKEAAPSGSVPYGPLWFGNNPTSDFTPENLAVFSGSFISSFHSGGGTEGILSAARDKGVKVMVGVGDSNPCAYWNSSTFTFNYNLFMEHSNQYIPIIAQYYPDTVVGINLLNEPHWINNPTSTCNSGVPPKYLYNLAKRVREAFAAQGLTNPNFLIGPNSHPSYIDNSIGFPSYVEPPGGGQLAEAEKKDGTINLFWIYIHTPGGDASGEQAIAKKFGPNGARIIYNTNANKAGSQLPAVNTWHCQQPDAAFVTYWYWGIQAVSVSSLQPARQACDGNIVPTPSPGPTIPPPTATPSISPTPVPGQLIAEYRFNEGLGSQALDTSGNNLHATINGATWTSGYYGSGLEFDSVNDFLDAGDPNLLDLNHYTLMAWVKQDVRGSDRQEIMEKADAYWINIRNDTGKLRSGGIYGTCSASGWKYLDSTTPIPLNTWTHVATTYDGSQLKIFFNGQPVGTMSVSGATCSNSNPLIIGAKNATTALFNGIIDEVRLYSRPLSRSEIIDAMNDSGGPTPTPPDCPNFNQGDANCDNKVDELDYVLWWNNYKKGVRADFNGDGITDELDYVLWWQNYGTAL